MIHDVVRFFHLYRIPKRNVIWGKKKKKKKKNAFHYSKLFNKQKFGQPWKTEVITYFLVVEIGKERLKSLSKLFLRWSQMQIGVRWSVYLIGVK